MDKWTREKIKEAPDHIRPILEQVVAKYGSSRKYPFHIARRRLLKMNEPIDENVFWNEFEEELNNPAPPIKMIHL